MDKKTRQLKKRLKRYFDKKSTQSPASFCRHAKIDNGMAWRFAYEPERDCMSSTYFRIERALDEMA